MKWAFLGLLLAAAAAPEDPAAREDLLWHHRNLGKAFYENPTTQALAVDEFKKALDLAPGSARERLNYALALMRAAKTAAFDRAMVELGWSSRRSAADYVQMVRRVLEAGASFRRAGSGALGDLGTHVVDLPRPPLGPGVVASYRVQ